MEAYWLQPYRLLISKYYLCRAPSLKSLRLISCHGVCVEGLAKAINKFPLLEELELSLCKNVFGKVYEVFGKACPHLKHFSVRYPCFYSIEDVEFNKDEEALGIATMFALRSLQLFGSELTNVGLTTVLDNCLYLEYLDIRHCFNIYMDATLRAKCARIGKMADLARTTSLNAELAPSRHQIQKSPADATEGDTWHPSAPG